jgi:hypothetical protein
MKGVQPNDWKCSSSLDLVTAVFAGEAGDKEGTDNLKKVVV